MGLTGNWLTYEVADAFGSLLLNALMNYPIEYELLVSFKN